MRVQAALGSILREVRRSRGWSQERLAERSGLDRSYVGEIERSLVSPTLATLEKLATALEVKVSVLIGLCETRDIPLLPRYRGAALEPEGDGP